MPLNPSFTGCCPTIILAGLHLLRKDQGGISISLEAQTSAQILHFTFQGGLKKPWDITDDCNRGMAHDSVIAFIVD